MKTVFRFRNGQVFEKHPFIAGIAIWPNLPQKGRTFGFPSDKMN